MPGTQPKPRVVATCAKPEPDVPKHPRASITLEADLGVVGDYHHGQFVRHRYLARRSPKRPNTNRQVLLVHEELLEDLKGRGVAIGPGSLGENITTRGLPLMELPPGTRLRVGAAVLEVREPRAPCRQLNAADARVLALVRGRAGMLCRVLEGGEVRPGDSIEVLP